MSNPRIPSSPQHTPDDTLDPSGLAGVQDWRERLARQASVAEGLLAPLRKEQEAMLRREMNDHLLRAAIFPGLELTDVTPDRSTVFARRIRSKRRLV